MTTHLPTIKAIADRGYAMMARTGQSHLSDIVSLRLLIAIAHAKAPLDLDRFLAADDFNFAHDFFGIYRHFDLHTGYRDFFTPRFQRQQG